MSNNLEKRATLTWNGHKTSSSGAPDTLANCSSPTNLNNKVRSLPLSDPTHFFIPFVYLGIVNGINCVGKVTLGKRFEKIDNTIKLRLGRRGDDDLCARYEGNLSSTKGDTTGTKAENSIARLKSRVMRIETAPGSGVCDLTLLALLWNCGKSCQLTAKVEASWWEKLFGIFTASDYDGESAKLNIWTIPFQTLPGRRRNTPLQPRPSLHQSLCSYFPMWHLHPARYPSANAITLSQTGQLAWWCPWNIMGVTRSPILKSVTSSPTAIISPLASSCASVC